jgi:hypothetical protein
MLFRIKRKASATVHLPKPAYFLFIQRLDGCVDPLSFFYLFRWKEQTLWRQFTGVNYPFFPKAVVSFQFPASRKPKIKNNVTGSLTQISLCCV